MTMKKASNASGTVTPLRRRRAAAGTGEATPAPALDPHQVLQALAHPVLVVGPGGDIHFANLAAQMLFGTSEQSLVGKPLADWLPADNPIFSIIRHALDNLTAISDHQVVLESPKIGRHEVIVSAGPLGNRDDPVSVSLIEVSVARRIDNQLTHRNAARSMTAMAAMLAHEIKNPLSGIRGAAQLLEQTIAGADRPLTRLICDETDRITGLVDRMDVFSAPPDMAGTSINIHEVLERVLGLARAGFARAVRVREAYDPSLPPVTGNFDQLVQVFLNLVKNAAEAAEAAGGEVTVTSAFRRGVAIGAPGGGRRVDLPITITVQDNGPGISPDIEPYLFDPFVSSKSDGTGLGLAIVAKIIDDHGGVIGFSSRPGATTFTVSLPRSPASGGGRAR